MIKPVLLLLVVAAICSAGPVTVTEVNSGPAACTDWLVAGIGTSAVTIVADGGVGTGGTVCTLQSTYPLTMESLDLTANLYTDGPLRPGYLLVTGDCSGGTGGSDGGEVDLSFGRVCEPDDHEPNGIDIVVPITLGTGFSVTIHGDASGNCLSLLSGPCSAGGWNMDVEIEAYDATLGFTPSPGDSGVFLTISGAPEPASIGLSFFGLITLVAFNISRRVTGRRRSSHAAR